MKLGAWANRRATFRMAAHPSSRPSAARTTAMGGKASVLAVHYGAGPIQPGHRCPSDTFGGITLKGPRRPLRGLRRAPAASSGRESMYARHYLYLRCGSSA